MMIFISVIARLISIEDMHIMIIANEIMILIGNNNYHNDYKMINAIIIKVNINNTVFSNTTIMISELILSHPNYLRSTL